MWLNICRLSSPLPAVQVATMADGLFHLENKTKQKKDNPFHINFRSISLFLEVVWWSHSIYIQTSMCMFWQLWYSYVDLHSCDTFTAVHIWKTCGSKYALHSWSHITGSPHCRHVTSPVDCSESAFPKLTDVTGREWIIGWYYAPVSVHVHSRTSLQYTYYFENANQCDQDSHGNLCGMFHVFHLVYTCIEQRLCIMLSFALMVS